ncbi:MULTISPECIES: LysR family transcriptional regulator [Rhodococcus]|uniref:LysR family transcriptional regulator n=1 Tax=Rhodococcus globerulus TaxID=33008 RepID=A0ABU4BNE8_RHOGO|nr:MULTISPECIES: LysR family transcriptional regulator [Rhodococcus]MDV6265769.1 LysR family transcriptional regulator [Rhodococcus globerulus]MDV8066914.1 LysR family transcriptional regulator [Rhodococcus sp. IEGM 1366]QXW01519.1 LysR family transcriptional regulator [Rhodococcus globerulus]
MNLGNLDLNLLVSLDALLRERSVTRAASRMNLSQPALSAALGKLRKHFADELLVRSGNSYLLTPLASQLLERCALALSDVERVFAATAHFDPAECEREFTILTSDYGLSILGPDFAAAMARHAPRVQIRFEQHSPDIIDHAFERLRVTDTIWLPHGFLSDLPHMDLYTDRWVCVAATNNPAITEELTVENLRTLPWVVNYQTPTAYTPATRQMELLGITPQIQVITDSFITIAAMISGTDRIALVQERLARRISPELGVIIWPVPFDVVPLVEAAWWHPLSDRDVEHRFMRDVLASVAESVSTDPHTT